MSKFSKRIGRVAWVIAAALMWPSLAVAHTETAPGAPGWTLDPLFLLPLAAAAWLWGMGVRRRWRRTRAGRSLLRREGALFAIGWLLLALAVVTPLHEAGERSFTAHMIEHEILMLAAAPLLAWSRPLPTMLWGMAQPWRRWFARLAAWTSPGWRVLCGPLVATGVQAAALWVWHMPVLFNLALADDTWHIAQHLSFFLSALFFWAAMLSNRRDVGVRALCLFATSIVSGALGAMMAFSQSPWYAPYAAMGMTPLGLTPAEDQQLAGLLMWVPGGVVHAGAALLLLAPLLSGPARRSAA